MSHHLPFVVGTYAKLLKPAPNETELPLFTWTCVLYLTGRPSADLSQYIERVEFTLHKSFATVCFQTFMIPH